MLKKKSVRVSHRYAKGVKLIHIKITSVRLNNIYERYRLLWLSGTKEKELMVQD